MRGGVVGHAVANDADFLRAHGRLFVKIET
jgi:hypothetical protein